MNIQSLILLGALPLTCAAGSLPALELPAGVGVNIHFTRGHEKDLDMIAAAGFKFVRMDFGWGGIERQKGKYDWSAYEELTANLEKRGLSALYILDYSNALYEETVVSRNPITGSEHRDTASPQRPESVEAFARWAAASANHFKGKPIIWEIWNEPNITFWKPKPDVDQYIALATATCQAIHKADPGAVIIAPATSGFPWDFLERLFDSGILQHLGGVSVHPYRNYSLSPETAGPDYDKLRKLIEQYAPSDAKRKMPIISGEWGYATHSKGVSLETQAAFAARQQLFNILQGIPLSIWYDWQNDGPDPDEREHNFGTVSLNLEPKPAYVAIQTLTRELSGFRIIRRLNSGAEKDYVLLCANNSGSQKLAAWTMGEPHEIRLAIDAASHAQVSATGSDGKSSTIKLDNDSLVLGLSQAPTYIPLNGIKLKN